MDSSIEKIFISADNLDRHLEDKDLENTDVIVRFRDGITYAASFFSYVNIENKRKNNSYSGENLNGKYYWAQNMVLIDKCSKIDIEQVIDHIIEQGDFHTVFKKL